jgi:hypothetical protein
VVLHAPRPDRTIDPKILDSYVGGYELASGLVVKVRRVGNQLIGRAGEQTPAEFVPATDTEFYVVEGPVKLVFEKDAAGKVVALKGWQNGEEFTAKKIQ